MCYVLPKRFGSMRREVLVERVNELSERMGNTLRSVSVVCCDSEVGMFIPNVGARSISNQSLLQQPSLVYETSHGF